MTDRPTAVTVVGWFSKGGGILGMVGALPYSQVVPDLLGEYGSSALLRLGPVSLFSLTFFSSFACVLIGHGILKGKSWARVAILVYCVVGTLVGALLLWRHPLFWFNTLTSVVFTVLVWVLLFRPDVSAYFRTPADVET